MKSTFVTYLLWMVGGVLGLHHFYLGRDRHAFIYWSTLGFCFVGWLGDLFRIPGYVSEANQDESYLQDLTERMRKSRDKPPFDLGKFSTMIFVSKWFALAVESAVPTDPEIYGIDLNFLKYLVVPISYAVGVHTVGNIGPREGGLKWPSIGAYLSYPVVTYLGWNRFIIAIVTALGFEKKELKWRRTPKKRRRLCWRIFVLLLCGLLFTTLWMYGFYINGEITEKTGEKVKIRDAVKNFFRSPLWIEFKNSLVDLWNFAQYHGWSKVWERLVEHMDPQGKQHAYKVLGLEANANENDITNRYRKLSREWHPDRHKDPVKKQEAQERFMEIQQAYETISAIRSTRTAKNKQE